MNDLVLDFGKYRGQRLSSVSQAAPQYVLWIATLPRVRSDPLLWPAVRGRLVASLLSEMQDELQAETSSACDSALIDDFSDLA